MNERRSAVRFRALDGALAALSSKTDRVGQIHDISVDGLSFRYIATNSPRADPDGTDQLKLMFAGKGIWLEGLMVKRIADIEVPADPSFCGMLLRRTCLQFLCLTNIQKTRLETFIQRYTDRALTP